MKRLTAVLLTLGIIVLMVANSADFFFRRPYYEYWDLAANSLSILRAKHFSELYGPYSRWGFHHPGPVFFYIQALGEWLFYDVLRLTPAPFNGQTLMHLCVMVSLFVAALAVFARWLSPAERRWFIPVALVLAALHFGAVARLPSYDMILGSPVFSTAWSADALVFPFLCLLTAGASIAAGRGEELPLMALAGGLLVHLHVAEPLFVGPLSLAAYAGLLVTTVWRERTASGAPVPWNWRMLGAAWRAFPQRHIVAGGLVALFSLPMVIDLFLGDASNIHAVLMHMREYHGVHKPFVRSLFYFVQFGAYRPYKVHAHMFKQYDKAGAYAYLWYHKKIYAAWIVGILLVIWTAAIRPALAAWALRRDARPASDGAAPALPSEPGGLRFRVWAGVFLLLSILLTLHWGTIQDGDMFYYNSWFNFAIYYFGLLIAACGLSTMLTAAVRRWKNGALLTNPNWNWFERLAPAGAVALVCVLHADRFRVRDPSPEANRVMHESITRIVQDARARNPKGMKVFDCPFFPWPAVTGVALEMARQGQPFMVVNGLNAEHFSVPFGSSYALRPTPPEDSRTTELWRFRVGKLWKMWVSGSPKWYVPLGKTLEHQLAVARREKDATGEVTFYPLLDNVELRVGVPIIRPGDDASLDFHKGGSGPGSTLYGFSDSETWGTWNLGTSGALRLRGGTVDPSDNVEISLDTHPHLAPDDDLISQRLNVAVNGTLLGAETCLVADEKVVYSVPGSLWNRTFGQSMGAALEFGFPDAVSPAKISSGGESDTRQLGVGLYGIDFRTVRAVHGQPALDLSGPDHQAEVSFKPGGNSQTFTGDGWYEPEPWGTWSNGHQSTLHFRSKVVDGTHDVEITLDIHSVMDTASAIKGQRVRALMGDTPFDYERTLERQGEVVLRVPATIWNWYVANDAEAVLQLDLPDAVSPARLDPTGQEQDERALAIGVERIRFREVPAPAITAR